MVLSAKRSKREKQQLSVHQLLKLSAGTACAHVSGREQGRWKQRGESIREASVWETSPLPLVASWSTSGDLSANLLDLCQCAVETCFILCGFSLHGLLVCSIVGGKKTFLCQAWGLNVLDCSSGVHACHLTINCPTYMIISLFVF